MDGNLTQGPTPQNGTQIPSASIRAIATPPATEGNEEAPPPTPLITQTQTLDGITLHAGEIDELLKT